MVDIIPNKYFDWMYDLVCANRFSSHISYKKLLMRLHDFEFRYSIPMDENRADDGENLRYRFARQHMREFGMSANAITGYLDGPCSVLEMMIALAIRCEESIMDEPNIGDRTGQWFWGMITNLGLGSMDDDGFDRQRVDNNINRLLDRDYASNGRGGLFTVNDCPRDLRDVEIWHQLCWYLDGIS